jgi:hypothetical protein
MLLLLFEKENKSHVNLGYLLAVLCFLREARPWELHRIAIIGVVFPVSPPMINISLKFELKG